MDWDELPANHETENDVMVPETTCPCSDEEMAILRDYYDPLASCDDYGVSTYLNVKDFIMHTRV